MISNITFTIMKYNITIMKKKKYSNVITSPL